MKVGLYEIEASISLSNSNRLPNSANYKENMELRRRLHEETMRADFYDTMVDVAEEMFGIEIRKKAGTGQSRGCTGTSVTK